MIKEHDRVVLNADIPEEGLREGDVGTVAHVYPDGQAVEVEFLALNGKTVAVITIPEFQVRPVNSQDITHARRLVAA